MDRRWLELPNQHARTTLVVGGAGFLGAHLARHLLERGERVLVLDNLSRAHARRNVEWLRAANGRQPEIELGDVRNAAVVRELVGEAHAVVHLAPHGTVHLLEAVRAMNRPPTVVLASSADVYGPISDLGLVKTSTRWVPLDPEVRSHGIAEDRPLDFGVDAGCVERAADTYVLDAARTFGLVTVVLRLGAVYGPRQIGGGEHAWIARALDYARAGMPVPAPGDGCHVRDALFIDDFARAVEATIHSAGALTGRAFNVGGGPSCAASPIELAMLIERLLGRQVRLVLDPETRARPTYYISDIRRFSEKTGWSPRVGLRSGLRAALRWLSGADQIRSTHA
jgi:CDP-paratose 2-epimerase